MSDPMCVNCRQTPATFHTPADLCNECWNAWWFADESDDDLWEQRIAIWREAKRSNSDE